MSRRGRRPSPEKLARDRWRQRVIDGMTPELRAVLSPAEVMYLWASGVNGDVYFTAASTLAKLREKGLIDGSEHLTQKGARWSIRILELYGAAPAEARHPEAGWLRSAGFRRTVRLANGGPELEQAS